MSIVKNDVSDITEQVVALRLREPAAHGEDLMRDRSIAALRADVDRIKRHLDLVDETTS